MNYEETKLAAEKVTKIANLERAIKFLEEVLPNESLTIEGRERCTGEQQRASLGSGSSTYIMQALGQQINDIKAQLREMGITDKPAALTTTQRRGQEHP